MFKEDFDYIQNYTEQVFDVLKVSFKDCKLMDLERKNDEVSFMFDTKACVDYIMYYNDQIIGLAHKMRREDYNDFNIRCKRFNGTKTEYEKLINAKANDTFSPTYHINSVENNGLIVKVAIIKTNDLLKAIKEGLGKIKSGSNTDFYCVNINKLIDNGYDIFVYTNVDGLKTYTIYHDGEVAKKKETAA